MCVGDDDEKQKGKNIFFSPLYNIYHLVEGTTSTVLKRFPFSVEYREMRNLYRFFPRHTHTLSSTSELF